MFYGEFTSKDDICRAFAIEDFQGIVVYAVYDLGSYEGSATVIFINQGKFWHVFGSHCSCYGLETQWSPEEMPLEALMKMIREGSGAVMHQHRDTLINMFDIVGGLDIENAKPEVVQVALRLAFI
jgi:hypothetical protein